MITVAVILSPWMACEACGTIGRYFPSPRCPRCTVVPFVEAVCLTPGLLPPVDRDLVCAHGLMVDDFHARMPLVAGALLDVPAPTLPPAASEACPACLEPVGRGVPVTAQCGHRMHRECAAQLIPGVVSGVRCPTCRTPVGRHDLPWDTSVSALVATARRVDWLLGRRGEAPLRELAAAAHLEAQDVCVYNVCVMQLANTLIDHRRMQYDMQAAGSGVDLQVALAEHVRGLVEGNRHVEATLQAILFDDADEWGE